MAFGVIRKRPPWTRRRKKRRRLKTPAPKTGWVIAELAQIAQVSVSTIRYYVRRGIITPSEFRGNITRYQRHELLRLLAIPRLQYEHRQSLAQIKQLLSTKGDNEVLAWLRERPLSPAAAAALSLTDAATTAQTTATATATPGNAPSNASSPSPTNVTFASNAHDWRRVLLLPGLELSCSNSASPAVRAIAQKIYEEYAPK